MKQYIKPQAKIDLFVSENTITKSGSYEPDVLNKTGYNIGTVKNLFK